MIIDYSTARPSVATLKAHGVTAVGRYIGWDGEPGFQDIHKNLTVAEVHDLRAAGIEIFLAFEYDPQAPLKGHDQGLKDAGLAAAQLARLSAPRGMTVYFAVDSDIRDYAPALPGAPENARPKLGPAAGYFDAVNHVSRNLAGSGGQWFSVGGYGGYYAISRLFDAGLITMGWQTAAWSGGQWDDRAVLRQEPGNPLAGADLDTVRLNTASGHDFGQWPRPPLPKPDPVKLETHVTAGHMSLHDLAAQRGTTAAHILRLTAKWDAFTPETYGWLNAVFSPESFVEAKNPMPAGLTLRCPALPS